MYIPTHFEETRTDVLHDLIRLHPLAALVTLGQAGLTVNHIPMLVNPAVGEFGMLVGHVARANPVWRDLSETSDSVAIFQGPQCYISPSWYPSKHSDGRVVPTWNYAVVHAHGVPRAKEDADWLLAHVTELSNHHELSQAAQWTVSDAPRAFVEQLLGAIVGIEIPISRIIGKWKVSQNRSAADQRGVVAALEARGDTESHAMAALVKTAAELRDKE